MPFEQRQASSSKSAAGGSQKSYKGKDKGKKDDGKAGRMKTNAAKRLQIDLELKDLQKRINTYVGLRPPCKWLSNIDSW
jgi:hypothetical protein